MTVVRVPKIAHRKPPDLRRKRGVMLFLSDGELERLNAEAERVGMPRATYMRWRLLYGGERPWGKES